MSRNKFQKFLSKPTQQNKDDKKGQSILSDNKYFLISTHSVQESNLDIIISEDYVDSKELFLEIAVFESPIKFVIKVTKESFQAAQDRQIISIKREITYACKVQYENAFRFQGQFREVTPNESTYNLNIIEICLKEYFISRRDQYEINKKLVNNTCYTNKKFEFGEVKIRVSNLMIQDPASTGIITKDTSIVYRSQEAKVGLLIEISDDCFKIDAVGEIALESMQKFLQIYHLRNKFFDTNHQIEIILYSRIYFPQYNTLNDIERDNKYYEQFHYDYHNRVCIDLYRKISQKKTLRSNDQTSQQMINTFNEYVYWMGCDQNINSAKLFEQFIENYQSQHIMQSIQDFIYYLNFSLNNEDLFLKRFISNYESKNLTNQADRFPIQGMITRSRDINLIEAITLVSQQFGMDHATRSLCKSGHSIIILSPGNGYYFADELIYKIALRNSNKNNIYCQLIAFGRIPNIQGPIFQIFKRGQEQTNNYNYKILQESNEDLITQKHAYWIKLVKFNEGFLSSFYTLYKQEDKDIFQLCIKKHHPISYSQVDFTLLPYINKQSEFKSKAEETMQQEFMKLIDDPQKKFESDFWNLQYKDKNSIIAQAPIQTIMNTSKPNIFQIANYERDKSQDPPMQTRQIQKQRTLMKQKEFSYYRMKWKLYQWDNPIHCYDNQMKQVYQKLFRQYLQSQDLDQNQQELFRNEAQWKNLCLIPILPLNIQFCYQEMDDIKSNDIQRSFDNLEEFERWITGILLAENFQQALSTGSIDQWGENVNFLQTKLERMEKFVKGETVFSIKYLRNEKKYIYNYYNKKRLKPVYQAWKYDIAYDKPCIHSVSYQYLLANEIVTTKIINFQETVDIDIQRLLDYFTISDKQDIRIDHLKPRGISYIFVEKELNKKDQKQFEGIMQFKENLSTRVKSFKDKMRLQTIMIKKSEILRKRNKMNEFKIKFEEDFPDSQNNLHNLKYEEICVYQQEYWVQRMVYNISLVWLSCSTSSILQLERNINGSLKNTNIMKFQIPQNIELQFINPLPFEQIIILLIDQTKKATLKKKLKQPPYDCVVDCSTYDKIFINRRGLFFIKFNENEILWKENMLYTEHFENQDVICEVLSQLKKEVEY
ncbi:hypothetical protein pb186bvf_006408 [Paramecium bursaria]